MNRTPAARFAQRTWSMLGLAKELRARFGEETLTDLLVLDMLPHEQARGFRLDPTTKLEESQWGADLLVAVRHPNRRCSRLVLQAKKLFTEDDTYRSFRAVTKSIAQLDKLEQCAQQHSALPLYLLYNHSSTAQESKHWHCPLDFDVGQLGCTLVPSWHIRQMLRNRPPPPRNFDRAHKIRQSIPWRCAFDCPDAENTLRLMGYAGHPETALDGPNQYPWFDPDEAAWPEWLFRESRPMLKPEDLDRIRNDLPKVTRFDADDAPLFIESDEWLYPQRLLMVDRWQEPLMQSGEREPPAPSRP